MILVQVLNCMWCFYINVKWFCVKLKLNPTLHFKLKLDVRLGFISGSHLKAVLTMSHGLFKVWHFVLILDKICLGGLPV